MSYKFRIVFVAFLSFMLVLTVTCAFAENGEITKIHELLERKTISNYNAIVVPLKGDPEHFNVNPSDNLEKIQFGNGYAAYALDYNTLKTAYEKSNISLSQCLVETPRFYFPVLVSGRPVAIVEVEETADGYKVVSVASGALSDNFIKTVSELENGRKEFKYINDGSIACGFLVSGGEAESFIDIDSVKLSAENVDIVHTMYERVQNAQTDNDLTGSSSSGESRDSTQNQHRFYNAILIIGIVVLGTFVILFVRKKVH